MVPPGLRLRAEKVAVCPGVSKEPSPTCAPAPGKAPACTADGLSEGDANYLRVVVAGLLGELGVDVDHVVVERPGEQRVAEQDVVEGLRVALEVVGVAL